MSNDLEALRYLSLKMLEVIHQRWTVILEAMTAEDFRRKRYHPEQEKGAEGMLSLDCWHSEHHFAHLHLVINS